MCIQINKQLISNVQTSSENCNCVQIKINTWHYLTFLAIDLLHPSPASERRKHKLKRLVPHPNSYFMDVKCPGCYKITTVFSHAQRVVVCAGCSTILCQPTGGRARLTEGCSFRRKQH
ncbi:40S ribosomal protein S27 isoform X1 [Bicyclus anynana]|uniref:40S ribosomal protein S27 n=1 Tax=Bicyclus anynana TaxID=110368 RepID=A0A6J1P205_BICAN|nr:40S ribosomal protein S27 isoform X1 [Bicyclus anynana]